MAERITYETKTPAVDPNNAGTTEKWNASDANMLKTVGNSHADDIEQLQEDLGSKEDIGVAATLISDLFEDGKIKTGILPIMGSGLNAAHFGVSFDEDEDQAPLINALLVQAQNFGVNSVYFPAGTYKILSQINIVNGVDIIGAGSDLTIFDASSAEFVNFPDESIFYGKGTLTEIGKLSANTLKFAGKQIVSTLNVTLKQGDVINVTDTVDFSYQHDRNYYREGEFLTVREDITAAKSIQVDTVNFGNYVNAASTNINKMDFCKANLRGFKVIGFVLPDQLQRLNCITLEYCGNCEIVDVMGINATSSSLRLNSCYNMVIDRVRNRKFNAIAIIAGATSYGISVNGQSIHIKNSDVFGYRHGITFTGSSAIIVSRFCTVTTSKVNSGKIAAMDFHGNAEYCKIFDNPMLGGVMMAGGNNTVSGNYITNYPDRMSIEFRELKNLNFSITNNKFEVNTGIATAAGILDLSFAAADNANNCIFDFCDNQILDNTSGVDYIRFNLIGTGNNSLVINFKNNTYNFTKSGSAAVAAFSILIKGQNTTNRIGNINYSGNSIKGAKTVLRFGGKVVVDSNIFDTCYNALLEVSGSDFLVCKGNAFFNWLRDYAFSFDTINTLFLEGNMGQSSASSVNAWNISNIVNFHEGANAFITPNSISKTNVTNSVEYSIGTNPIVGGGTVTPPSALSYTSPNTFTQNVAITPLSPTVTGTATSYSVSPTLPAGLSLNTSTGVISGTPTTSVSQSSYTVSANNSGGSTTFDILIAVTADIVAPSGLTYTSPVSYTEDAAITPLMPVISGSPSTFSASPSLPAGLTLNTSTGVISGAPTTPTSIANYTITATNTAGSTTFDISITITEDTALTKLIGTRFTLPGQGSTTGNTASKTNDDDLSTFWDMENTGAVYTGYEFATPQVVKEFRYAARAVITPGDGINNRIRGAKLQGSNTSNSTGFVDLYTIPLDSVQPETPIALTVVPIADNTAYKWVRVLFVAGSRGNAAEVQFWG